MKNTQTITPKSPLTYPHFHTHAPELFWRIISEPNVNAMKTNTKNLHKEGTYKVMKFVWQHRWTLKILYNMEKVIHSVWFCLHEMCRIGKSKQLPVLGDGGWRETAKGYGVSFSGSFRTGSYSTVLIIAQLHE